MCVKQLDNVQPYLSTVSITPVFDIYRAKQIDLKKYLVACIHLRTTVCHLDVISQ